jgi:hypothetical protein
MQLLPGLLVVAQGEGQPLTRLNMELLVDQFLEKRGEAMRLGEMLEEWEDEMEEIVGTAWRKVGVDVGALGSKRAVKEHKCKFCKRVFHKAQALGGHISKIHSHVKKEAIAA